MGDKELSQSALDELNSKLSVLNSKMINQNNKKVQRHSENERNEIKLWSIIGTAVGALGGGLIAGPPGAVVGAASGAGAGGITRSAMSEGCSS